MLAYKAIFKEHCTSIRDDFKENSDIDFLVTYDDDSDLIITLLDIVKLQYEFEDMFNREVDIVEKEGLRNPRRKQKILSSAEVIYAN